MVLPVTTPTSTLRDIKVLHLESTDVCQASCPLCARETDHEFQKNVKHHLDMHKILQVFDAQQISQLHKMFMCGNYGDPAAGKHTLEIYRKFRQCNPNIVLGMNTNGGLRTPLWWAELGSILNQHQDYVIFSIDGLQDTNHVYRQGVDWHKLMKNIASFIESGGSAHWDMLVYRHNEHQVEQCQSLARSMGFTWFRAKVSRRGFNSLLQPPANWSQSSIPSIDIDCHALNEQSLYIDAQGRVSPCCWLGSRQSNFVKDFDSIQQSWNTSMPNQICVETCGNKNGSTSFARQWQLQVQLC